MHNGSLTAITRTAAQLEREGRYARTRRFYQHGGVTVYAHCVRVAALSCRLADAMGLAVDRAALVRGALLHDYFLYDWHDKDPSHRLHGFTHPRRALENAAADWELTDRERDIILHHMFPLTPLPPRSREAWLVCLADKLCAVQEMAMTPARRRMARAGAWPPFPPARGRIRPKHQPERPRHAHP